MCCLFPPTTGQEAQEPERRHRRPAREQRENPDHSAHDSEQLRQQNPPHVLTRPQDLRRVLPELRAEGQAGNDRHAGRAPRPHGAHPRRRRGRPALRLVRRRQGAQEDHQVNEDLHPQDRHRGAWPQGEFQFGLFHFILFYKLTLFFILFVFHLDLF